MFSYLKLSENEESEFGYSGMENSRFEEEYELFRQNFFNRSAQIGSEVSVSSERGHSGL